MKPTVISTFAGCGGSSLGYKMAGYKVLAAVEWDGTAAETYRMNFPDVPVLQQDIADVAAKELLELTGLARGELDVLDGSPPCQGFSTAGKRKLDDPRNTLFKEFVRLLDGLGPKAFVMENVSGLVKGKMKWAFVRIMRELKAAGYKVRCRLLDAAWFGVPQHRKRLIWIGMRDDLGVQPMFPEPLPRLVTVRQALQGIEAEHKGNPNGDRLRLIHAIPPGDTNGGGKYSLRLGMGKGGFGLARLAWDKPSYTICKSQGSIVHPDYDAYITARQAARLSSFPDDFRFPQNDGRAWELVGNSVPPLLMKAIAGAVKVCVT